MLFVDKALEGRVNLIGGANKEDYHPGRTSRRGRIFIPRRTPDLRAVTAWRGLSELRGAALRIDTVAVERSGTFSGWGVPVFGVDGRAGSG